MSTKKEEKTKAVYTLEEYEFNQITHLLSGVPISAKNTVDWMIQIIADKRVIVPDDTDSTT